MRWVRNLRERAFGTFEEGPDPPERLADAAEAFAAAHLRATRGEWIAFAAAHAGEAYRSGYVRGLEWAERDPEKRPDVPPDMVADAVDPGWRWRRGIPVDGGITEVVPDEWTDAEDVEHVKAQIREVNRGGR